MIEKFGSDAPQLDTITGGITSADGTLLIDTDSSGSSAVAFGAATRRLLLSGIENGDFSAGAPDNSTAIGSDNPLPYYTYTQGTNTGITAKWLDSYTYGDGNAIKWEIAANRADTSLSPAYIERIVPVASTASKRYGIWVNASWGTGSGFALGGAAGETYLEAQYLKADGTTTGTADVAIGYAFDDIDTQVGVYGTCKPNDSYVPTDAVALRIRAGVVQATSPIGIYPISIHLEELQLNIGKDINIFTDLGDPATYDPAFINQLNGVLNISSGASSVFVIGQTTSSGNITSQSGNITATTGNITATAGNITATAGVSTGDRVRATSTAEATLSSTTHGFQIGANAGANLRMDTNEIMAVNNGAAAPLYLQDQGGDVYIGDAATSAGDLILGTSATSTTGALLFKNGTGGSIRPFSATSGNTSIGVYNSSGSAYTALVASGFYPNQGSSFFSHNGTNLTANDSFSVTGAITATGQINAGTTLTGGALTCDAITGTTATTNAAIWVLLSGTNYALRRNTSSARYKTNIEDADEAVLEAARKVKPRHYESTIDAEKGATRLGFIAEEIFDAGLTHAVGLDAEGRPETLDSVALIAALFARVNDLEQRLAKLEGEK